MRNLYALIAGCVFFSLTIGTAGAEKSRVAIVSPSPNLSMPWVAKEAGIFSKHGLDVDVILLTGSPRLVQSLIAGDVDYAPGLVTLRMVTIEKACWGSGV